LLNNCVDTTGNCEMNMQKINRIYHGLDIRTCLQSSLAHWLIYNSRRTGKIRDPPWQLQE
jgi:hypothetical protein